MQFSHGLNQLVKLGFNRVVPPFASKAWAHRAGYVNRLKISMQEKRVMKTLNICVHAIAISMHYFWQLEVSNGLNRPGSLGQGTLTSMFTLNEAFHGQPLR